MPSTPETQKAAANATEESSRLTQDSDRGNGAKQILARAAAETHDRDAALHKYEWYELVTSALQIAIVLASVSVITQVTGFLFLGLGIGVVAGLTGAVIAAGLV